MMCFLGARLCICTEKSDEPAILSNLHSSFSMNEVQDRCEAVGIGIVL